MSMSVGWVLKDGISYVCMECASRVSEDEIDYSIDNSKDDGPIFDDIVCRECGKVILEATDQK